MRSTEVTREILEIARAIGMALALTLVMWFASVKPERA